MNLPTLHTLRSTLYAPLSRQWPLLLAYMVLMGWGNALQNPFYRTFLIVLHAWLAAALVEWTRSRIVKSVVYVLLYFLFIIELGLEWMFSMHLSPAVITLLVETDARESSEFLESLLSYPELWQVIGCTGVLMVLNIVAEHYRKTVTAILEKGRTALVLRVVLAILLIGGVLSSACYIPLLRSQELNEVDQWFDHKRHPHDTMTKLLVALVDVRLANKEMEGICQLAAQVEATPQTDTDTINVVFVIGESYIKYHSPLYGYSLNTTPFLSAEQDAGRLFVFNDVLSPYNQTSQVLRNLISCNSLGDGERWSEKPPLTAVFKKNGFHVAMFDNQRTADYSEVFAFSLNTFLYHPQVVQACYDEVNDTVFEYDGQMVDYIPSTFHLSSSSLTIVHLLGQHVGFSYRYPKPSTQGKSEEAGWGNVSLFTADSIRRSESWLTDDMKAEIAHYDNATLYNDYVIHQLTQLYADGNTVLVYLSDHGEEVYDYRPRFGREGHGDPTPEEIHWQYEVPLMVWCSPRYVEKHPDIVEALRKAVDRPFSIDNTCHLLFHLAGLRTPYYISRRDVIADDYQCPPRMVNDKRIEIHP